jgi:site-specific recombinase XerD
MLPVPLGSRSLARVFSRLPKYYKREEIQRILSNRLKHDHYEKWFLCSFLWNTGMRISEALSVLYQDIDYLARTVRIVTLKRRGHERVIPIQPDFLLETKLFQQCQQEKRTSKKRNMRKMFHINRSTAHEHVKFACRLAGFSDGREHPHTFRHSFAINCLLHGVPITTLQRWLGHANITNTLIYTALTGREDQTLIGEVDFGTSITATIMD